MEGVRQNTTDDSTRRMARPRRGRVLSTAHAARPRVGSRRLFGLAVQTLARQLLSGDASAESLARLLRAAVRHGRNQQYVLSIAGGILVPGVAPAGASPFRVRGESEPLSHAHEKAEGSRRADRTVLRPRAPFGTCVWTGLVSASTALAGESRAARHISVRAASSPSLRDRISCAQL